nr:PilW family protein [Gammaproteobacteria bacterium]
MNARPFASLARAHRQGGVSIVEIMVALTVSLVLLGGVLQVYLGTTQANRVHEGISRIQENGRFAMAFLSRDIRMADFWGCANFADVTNNLDPAGGAGYIDFGAGGVVGTEGGSNPDSLILRSAFDTALSLQPPYGPQASADVKVVAGNGLNQSDIVVVSDCEKADIFQITNSNPDGSGQLVHNTGNTTSPGNYNATNPGCPGGGNAQCLSKVYGQEASVYRLREIQYFIANNPGGEPALFRNDGSGSLELAEGIENLQILYGEDTDGDRTANRYIAANGVADMNAVVSVRVSLLVRSREDNLTTNPQAVSYMDANVVANERRLRQVFTSTITIRNRAA